MEHHKDATGGESSSTNNPRDAIKGAKAELNKDSVRSFTLLTVEETGHLVHTWNNNGDGDMEAMLGYGIASLAETSNCSLQEAAVAVLKRARGMEAARHEPVDTPAPSSQVTDR